MKIPPVLLLATLLAACGAEPAATVDQPATATPSPTGTATTPAATPADAKRFAGRWTGVEGMYLDVTPTIGADVALEMQWDLDHKGRVTGRADRDGIAFTRDGQALRLRPTGGEATGLKYLAGKTNCLTVRPGEGYCRE